MRQYISAKRRRQVQQRAGSRCEYCGKPEGYSPYNHHVDHIRPVKHGGSNDLENLAWACFHCNICKGSNISSYDDQTGELTPLFNPRTQTWQANFVLDSRSGSILGRTPTGRVTVLVMRMNDEAQIVLRKQLIAKDLLGI